ncbi:MAG TPA: methyltransferase domain-containing protein [Kofleriaceae bacterium]|nr:methyltransferase domain-containing protein [Kofleriaceae bacterium]
MNEDFSDERRQSFDKAAAAYDKIRPGYPEAAIDDILERSQAVRALEVGAGTGKATLAFARCGVEVHALEPGGKLADILRAKTIGLPVTIEETTFEAFEGGEFDLVFSAQAWHWTDPATRYQKAHAVLQPGGALALLMNEKAPVEQGLRDDFDAAYAKWFGWPAWDNDHLPKLVDKWSDEIKASKLFRDLVVTYVPWTQSYTSDEFIELLATYSDHAVRPEEQRRGCYADIKAAIDKRGGRCEIPYVTLAFFALRCD